MLCWSIAGSLFTLMVCFCFGCWSVESKEEVLRKALYAELLVKSVGRGKNVL